MASAELPPKRISELPLATYVEADSVFVGVVDGTTYQIPVSALTATALGFVTATRQVLAGTGLTGGGPLTSDVTLSLATNAGTATAGTYGSSSQSPVMTVDAYGRITAISNASITPGSIGALSATGGTISGGLTVASTFIAQGTASVGGAVGLASTLTVQGAVAMASNLSVAGTASVTGAIGFASTLTVQGAVTLASSLSVAGTASVTGAVAFASSLRVAGTATLVGTVNMATALTVAGTASFTGAVGLASNLAVAGTATFAGAVNMATALTVGGTASVTGAVSLASSMTVAGTASVTGAVSLASSVTIAGTSSHTGAAAFASSIVVAGTASVTGAVGLASALTVAGTASVAGAAAFQSTAVIAGLLSLGSVGGGGGTAGALEFGGIGGVADFFRITNATAITGGNALRLYPGSTPNGYVEISSAGKLTLATGLVVASTASVTGPVGLATTLTVGGSVTAVGGTATPAGGSTSVGYIITNTSPPLGVFPGSGVPTLAAAQGSLYLRSDGTATNTRAYIAQTATGSWTALFTAA